MTRIFSVLAPALLLALARASSSSSSSSSDGADADGKYTISSEGIRAQFIPYGASLTNLFINDTSGTERDIVLGYDNASYYSVDPLHPHYGGVPGRYANRIKNSTFVIDGEVFKVDANENDGADTLHGGSNGWDWRNFTVVSHTPSSITFSIVDPDGEMGFPGEVISYITYTVQPYEWDIKMVALATTAKTPIMLSSHVYWNLDAFQNPSTPDIKNHTLHLPYSGQRISVDSILIPDGPILSNTPYSVNDWWSGPKPLGANLTSPDLQGNCGAGCVGYDNCYLVNRGQDGPFDWRSGAPVATLHSAFSGISVRVWTDQEAFQIFSCPRQAAAGIPLKKTQGFHDGSQPRTVQDYACVVLEVEDWIDAINHPEWQREGRNVFGPEDGAYTLEAVYRFGVDGRV